MIYFLTPTGGRQQGLSLLGEYLEAQTYNGHATWLIVDDCDPASFVPTSRFEIVPIRPNWRWKKGMNTQGQSLLAGLAQVPVGAKLLILEDDDCYLPEYVQVMVNKLDEYDLVGEKVSRYYNVSTKRYKMMNGRDIHASLMCTAMKGSAIDMLKLVCQNGRMIDMKLWQKYRGSKILIDDSNTVGIKGMPGRMGIGVGHRQNFGVPDDGTVLKEWVGEYAFNY